MLILKRRLISLTKKAETSYANKELLSAERFTDEALDIAIKLYGKNHPNTIQSLINKAVFLLLRKAINESKIYFEKAIEINSATPNINVPKLCEAYDGLAHLYRITGDYQKSFDYFTYVTQLAKDSNNNIVATYYCGLARLSKLKNDFNNAIMSPLRKLPA